MSFPECHIFKACPGLSVVLLASEYFKRPPRSSLSRKFPGKMGEGYVYEPPRVYLLNLPEGEVLCILFICSIVAKIL